MLTVYLYLDALQQIVNTTFIELKYRKLRKQQEYFQF